VTAHVRVYDYSSDLIFSFIQFNEILDFERLAKAENNPEGHSRSSVIIVLVVVVVVGVVVHGTLQNKKHRSAALSAN